MELSLNRLMFRPATTSDPDVSLIHRLAQGDSDAIRQIYAAYGQRMYAYALRLTGTPAIAEDVVQDSLVAAWQGARNFKGQGRVIAWLLGIIHHKALNAVRGRPTLAVDESLEIPDSSPAPDDQASVNEQRRLLRKALSDVPFEQRTALELVFYQGLSLEEAAQVCRCPVGTIKSRLNYAKTALRGALQRAGLSAEDVQ